jgi:hypothetical protein
MTGGPCELYTQDGFASGWHTIDVDIELSLFANPQKGQLVVFSTADTFFGQQ